jgi:6-phosphogluconolactonase
MKHMAREADKRKILIGTGTGAAGADRPPSRGIYQAELDTATGALAITGLAAELVDPTFLARTPDGGRLYAVSEISDYGGESSGAVAAFAMDPATGNLILLDIQPSGGAGPAYVSLDRTGRVVLVANYGAGSVASLPVEPDGRLQPPSQVWQHTGAGPQADRQEAPHAHCIVPDPANRYAVVADLGADKLFVYPINSAETRLDASLREVATRPGMGPRHLAFHPALDVVYVSGELDSTVSVFAYTPGSGALAEAQHVSTLPAGFTGENYPSEIAVAPSGRFVYCANRLHDSLAVFAVDPGSGQLTPAGHVALAGLHQAAFPRHFAIDPSGEWLLVANQRGHNVAVFRVDASTGLPEFAGAVDIATPMHSHLHHRLRRALD